MSLPEKLKILDHATKHPDQERLFGVDAASFVVKLTSVFNKLANIREREKVCWQMN